MAEGSREGAAPTGKPLRERFADLAARVVSAVVLVLVVVLLLWWGEIPFTVGIILLAAGGLWELYSTFRRHGYRPAGWLSLAAGCSFPLMAYLIQRGDNIDLTPMLAALALYLPVLLAWCLFGPHSGSPTTDVAVSLLGVVLVGFCLSHFVLMLRFDSVSWTAPFAVIVMVWIYDAVAYFAGSAFGKHKLAPRVSPGKSWEGTLAGSAGAFIAAYVLYLTLNREWLTLGVSMELAALVCVFGPLGDLSESMVKRELGIKDMSSLIPGHGGIMDRFDSMFLTAVASYYFLRFLVFKL
ncbi:MAG: phosphatidate cytidylyltransferase [Actinobacteria bacterium]|nr:phosphatidate cytidylyltransferase [Actinomycetota bacterium]